MPDTMTIEQFEIHLTRYGRDLDAWPSPEGQDAKALLAVSKDARRIYDLESALDQILAKTFRKAEVPAALPSSIAAQAHRDSQVGQATPSPNTNFTGILEQVFDGLFRPIRSIWAQAGSLALIAALGFVMGHVGLPFMEPSATPQTAMSEELEYDLASLAFGTDALDWSQTDTETLWGVNSTP